MQIPKEARIGLITIIVLALTIWGYNFLKGKNIFNPTESYYILFDRADGLIESGNVMYQGYKVGNITALEFNPGEEHQFRVKIIIEDNLKIPVNSEVYIKQVNPLASTADLEISFSSSKEFHEPGDTLNSKVAKGIGDYLAEYQGKLDSMLNSLDSTLSGINSFINGDEKGNLKNITANLDETIAELKKSMGPGGSITKSMQNVEKISSTIAAKDKEIASSIDNLSNVTASLDSANLQLTLQKLDSTMQSVNHIMAKLDEGEGSMGKLLNDSSLYTNLDSTSYYLSKLMKDMQENPKRYVHFSLFGNKKDE